MVIETYETKDVDLMKYADTWSTYVPLKMATTIWRMFQNKIVLMDAE